MRSLRRGLLASVVAALVAVTVWALLPKPVAIDAARVARRVFEEVVDEDGRTRVRNRYVVSSPLSGQLERITLRAGDRVVADGVVAVIQPVASPLLDARTTRELTERLGAAEARLEQARAALERARVASEQSRTDLERTTKLAAEGIVAASELDRVRLAFRVADKDLAAADYAAHTAEHDVESARAALARVREGGDEPFDVTSPVAGRVFRVLVESAGAVVPGTALLEIADPQDLEVVVDVLTPDAVRIPPGASVRIERWGGDQPLDGRVRLVEPSGFTKLSALGVEEQRTNVVIDLTSPAEEWRTLGDGFRVDARIVVSRVDDGLTVPASALFRDEDGWATFVVDGGRAHKRVAVSPRRNARDALIESGLAEGETVILYPTDAIADGVRVRVR